MRTKIKNNEPIKKGSVLITEKPFVYVLKSKLRSEYCDNCLQKVKLLKCSGCQYVYYCNRVCQKESWPLHKHECSNLRKVSPRVVPDAARLMAKIIVKMQKGGDQERGYYTEMGFRRFKDLMSHYSDIKQDQKRMEHFTSLCAVLFEFIGEVLVPNSAELMGIYGRVIINGFNILDPEMTSIATGIYLGCSVLDHSCEPNALAVFQGTTIYIRALTNLPSLDFKQIFISYIDLLNSPSDRQEELKQSYYFLCNCPRCFTEKTTDIMNSAICPNGKCGESILINPEEGAENICPKCETKLLPDFVNEFLDAVDFTNIQLQNMKQSSVLYLDVCNVCLKKQHGFLHPLNLLHVKTLDAAFESSIEIGQWEDAKNFGIELISGYKKYYGHMHPLLGLLYLKIGKILVFENQSAEALSYLKLAADILHVTHGSSHSLCSQQLAPLLYQASAESALVINNYN